MQINFNYLTKHEPEFDNTRTEVIFRTGVMQYFARSGALVGFPEMVRGYGEHPYRLMREVGLSPALLKDTDLYIPYTSLAELLALAAERCGAPEFGARLGYRQGLEAVGALGSLMCMQSTIADAVRILLRNLAFHAHGVQIDVDVNGSAMEMRMAFAFEARTDCRQLIALSLALLVSGTKQLNAGAPQPEEVELALADNGNFEAYRAFLGPNLQFGGLENRVQYPTSLLNLPVLATNDVRQRISQQWQRNQTQIKVPSLRSLATVSRLHSPVGSRAVMLRSTRDRRLGTLICVWFLCHCWLMRWRTSFVARTGKFRSEVGYCTRFSNPPNCRFGPRKARYASKFPLSARASSTSSGCGAPAFSCFVPLTSSAKLRAISCRQSVRASNANAIRISIADPLTSTSIWTPWAWKAKLRNKIRTASAIVDCIHIKDPRAPTASNPCRYPNRAPNSGAPQRSAAKASNSARLV